MPDLTDNIAPRREFLGQLALGAMAVAATACAPGAMATPAAPAPAPQGGGAAPQGAAPAPPAPAAPVKWDDSWAARITGKHKAVFDVPAVSDGLVIANANVYMSGMKQAFGVQDSDISVVIVLRHAGISMAFDDEFWAKYEIGRMLKIKDSATNKWATRNQWFKDAPDAKRPSPYTFDSLSKRGAILMGCNLAAMGMAQQVGEKYKLTADAARAEVRAHLLPGLTLAPNGVFATLRAQEAGCGFMRSA